MFIAWTTVATRADADKLAAEVVRLGLAACVQVDGPLTSLFRWDGRLERVEEFRLCLKCLPDNISELERYVLSHHPYEVPEWLVVRAENAPEKYLSWARSNSTNLPL